MTRHLIHLIHRHLIHLIHRKAYLHPWITTTVRFFFILWCFIKSSQPCLRSFPQLKIRLCWKTGQEDDVNSHTRHLHFKYAELQWGITVMGIIVIVVVVVVMIYDYDYDYDCILCDPLQFFFLSHVWAAIPQLIDITLSARYGRYQGWLGTVHFQKYLVDSTSHTRPLHSPR